MKSLYERIGGMTAVDAAVDLFYDKVLADERIRHFFKDTDMARQRAHQKAFLSVAFGGPNSYSGRGMRSGHARLVANGLNDSHYDAVLENLENALLALGVDGAAVSEVVSIAESVRGDVLGR